MRPITLTMTAFGSYAQPTTVDFQQLDQGVYLVTGDTGAGKTTIFDAIVFALYGEASGSDRSAGMMHCDLVERSTDTQVRLCFSQGGKRYTVERGMHFQKNRKTGEYEKCVIRAELTGEGLDPINVPDKVTKKCTELLGLNADQFRRIVMLAQGEFRQFLKANSEEKNQILGRLFDSSPYVYFQSLLEAASKKLEQRRRGAEERLSLVLNHQLRLPEGEDPADYLPGSPQLPERLEALLAREAEQSALLETALGETRQRQEGLLIRRTEALTLQKDLQELARWEEKDRELEKLRPAMEARTQALAQAEPALHKALPALTRAREAQTALETALRVEAEYQQEAARLEQVRREAEQTLQAAEPLGQELERIKAQRAVLAEQLGLFGELETREKALQAAERRAAELQIQGESLQRQRNALEETQAKLARELEALEGTQLETERCRREKTERDRALASFRSEKGILAQFERVNRRGRELLEREARFRDLTEQYVSARQRAASLRDRFILGQAGILAQNTRQTLAETGTARCPVCGRQLTPAHSRELAPLAADTPSEQELKAAEEAAGELEKTWNEKQNSLREQQAKHRANQDIVLNNFRLFEPDCPDWEHLAAPGCLAGVLDRLKTQAAEAGEALTRAEARQREQNQKQTRSQALEQQLRQLRERQDKLRQEQGTQAGLAGAARGQLSALRAGLQYKTRQEAAAREAELAARSESLRRTLDRLTQDARKAGQDLAQVRGQLEAAGRSLGQAGAEAAQAEAAWQSVSRETGFADEAAVQAALAPAGTADREAWLRQEQAALIQYREQLRVAGEQRETLRAKTAGKSAEDPASLGQALEAAKAETGSLETQLQAAARLLDNHRQVRDQVETQLRDLESTQAAWERLSKLAELAKGSKDRGGKLSFDRYVMGAVFREILEMANRRLDLISGGRYELIHSADAERSNAKAGLEIEVLDLSTGKQRPSASLSGGEAFYTSLALALGLSDVVQARAGGMKLEALFIDEGFGSLDDEMLSKALEVLNQLTQGDRLVGIISHVDKLCASIPQQIVVTRGPGGSTLKLVK